MIIKPEEFRKETKRATISIWVLYLLVAILVYLISPNNFIFITSEIVWLVVHTVGSAIWWKKRARSFKCIKCGSLCKDASTQVSNVNAVKTIIRHCSSCNVYYSLGAIGDDNPMP